VGPRAGLDVVKRIKILNNTFKIMLLIHKQDVNNSLLPVLLSKQHKCITLVVPILLFTIYSGKIIVEWILCTHSV
jgi:hypothetical protein